MTDWGMSGRRDSYSFVLCDPFTLQEAGTLQAEPSACSITYGRYTDNRVQATVTAVNDTYRRKGRDKLVRIKHHVELPNGETADEVLGTFFADKSSSRDKDGVERLALTCYSTMWRLSQDYLADDYVRRKGETIEGGIRRLIEYPGGTLITDHDVPTDRNHTVDVRFACGSNRLETINTICGWAGWTLGVDDLGRQTLSKYVPPSMTAPFYSFEVGRGCIRLPEMDETFTGDVCNRVVARWSRESLPASTDATYSWGYSQRAVSTLQSSADLSWERCGRYITHVLDISEPCSAADLQVLCDQYLAEHDAAIRYLEIEHVGVPGLRPGMTVRLHEEGNDAMLCEITQMEVPKLGPLCLTRTKLKVIE